jgi:amino acid transporter
MVALLLTVIVLSYRKVIQAYPSGGGDYEVAKTNLGRGASLIVASALLLDYVMTVAVSIASGTDNLISAFPQIAEYRVEIAVASYYLSLQSTSVVFVNQVFHSLFQPTFSSAQYSS